ncbi:MAG: biotin/lipoyl-containing protein [Bacillota bacterium]
MKKFRVTVDGTVYEVEVEELGGEVAARPVQQEQSKPATPASVAKPMVAPPGKKEERPAAKPAAPATAGGYRVTAPLPGVVVAVKISVGQQVVAGQTLLVLEAMKMENEIQAAQGGMVKEILVSQGASVNSGDVMVVIG